MGKNADEAEVVRMRTPMQTEAILQAALFRLVCSFNFSASN